MVLSNTSKELRKISDALRDLGYSDFTIGIRQRYWMEYCSLHGSLDIDEGTMREFLLSQYSISPDNINLNKKQYEVRAAMRNLLEFRRFGKIINYHTPWFTDMPWIESFKPVLDDFFSYQKDRELKPQTLLDYERTLKRFTTYLDSIGLSTFDKLNCAHVTAFITDSITEIIRNLGSMLCRLRVFFRYLYINGHTKEDISLLIPKSNVLLKRKHIPSTWTREDIKKILAAIDKANPIGKRDYAIILLVARLGLRVSDVVRLRFDNIQWEKNCIYIVQYKTNTPLILPLFEDVGIAIIDYLKNGRPTCDLDRVFITHKPPFRAFSDNNHLYEMFNKYLYKSGIEVTPDKNHGLHSLRHSLATELMKKEIPLPVISEILGHKSLETTMQYLRADTEQLRYCTLVEGENYAT